MKEFDVRGTAGEIESIVFGEPTSGYFVHKIRKAHHSENAIELVGEGDYIYVRRADVENLIKALQKAWELGWNKPE